MMMRRTSLTFALSPSLSSSLIKEGSLFLTKLIQIMMMMTNDNRNFEDGGWLVGRCLELINQIETTTRKTKKKFRLINEAASTHTHISSIDIHDRSHHYCGSFFLSFTKQTKNFLVFVDHRMICSIWQFCSIGLFKD